MNLKSFNYTGCLRIYNDKNVKFIPVYLYNKKVHFFSIMYCSLISLKHSPKIVSTTFKIFKNNLKTLYHCPKRVGERIDYSFNTLFSSDFLPLTFAQCYDHLR